MKLENIAKKSFLEMTREEVDYVLNYYKKEENYKDTSKRNIEIYKKLITPLDYYARGE